MKTKIIFFLLLSLLILTNQQEFDDETESIQVNAKDVTQKEKVVNEFNLQQELSQETGSQINQSVDAAGEESSQNDTGLEIQEDVINMTKCNPSCNCDLKSTECAECNICTSCKQSEGTQIVDKAFCQCLSPDWVKKKDSWECIKASTPSSVPKCEWELFNQIFNMVVHSNCSLEKNDDGTNVVQDILSYDWIRTTVPISDECKGQLTTKVLWSQNCKDYESLSLNYVSKGVDNSTLIRIPLIDVYSLTQETKLTGDGRTIYQIVCLAIELGHQRRTIRQHRFQIRVFTNRDRVEVFHMTVSKQITEGCDKGQECIVVANLDTKGDICKESSCNSYYLTGVVPTYTVGDHMYVRISFTDSNYQKYLSVISVRFVDDNGIYTYQKGVQWNTLRQELGYVDVDVLLFQPQVNATVEVALKISLQKDGLRNLEQKDNNIVSQQFKVEVKDGVSQKKSSENSSLLLNFACLMALICFLI